MSFEELKNLWAALGEEGRTTAIIVVVILLALFVVAVFA